MRFCLYDSTSKFQELDVCSDLITLKLTPSFPTQGEGEIWPPAKIAQDNLTDLIFV